MVKLKKRKKKKKRKEIKEEESIFSQQTKGGGKRCLYNDPTVVNTSVFIKLYTEYNKAK